MRQDEHHPWSFPLTSSDWIEEAAKSLAINGFCVLRGQVVPPEACDSCKGAIYSRLDELLQAAHKQNIDIDGLMRYNEMCKRQPGCRYDMRLHLDRNEPWSVIKAHVDDITLPILRLAAIEGCQSWAANVAGCVVSAPGAPTQPSHTDGASAEFVNAFVPLVDVTAANGPTEIEPGSQLQLSGAMPDDPYAPLPHGVAPQMARGELLLFQYRATHRGCANTSSGGRPMLYFTYGAHGLVDTHKHNFPSDTPLL
jgi:hypothetical protein